MTAPRRALRLLLATFAVAALLLLGLLWLRPGADPQVEGSMPAAVDLDDATPLSDHPAAQRIAVDLRRLADDSMEGRETGSRGHDLAAAYVAAQFADAGLEPAGQFGKNECGQLACKRFGLPAVKPREPFHARDCRRSRAGPLPGA